MIARTRFVGVVYLLVACGPAAAASLLVDGFDHGDQTVHFTGTDNSVPSQQANTVSGAFSQNPLGNAREITCGNIGTGSSDLTTTVTSSQSHATINGTNGNNPSGGAYHDFVYGSTANLGLNMTPYTGLEVDFDAPVSMNVELIVESPGGGVSGTTLTPFTGSAVTVPVGAYGSADWSNISSVGVFLAPNSNVTYSANVTQIMLVPEPTALAVVPLGVLAARRRRAVKGDIPD